MSSYLCKSCVQERQKQMCSISYWRNNVHNILHCVRQYVTYASYFSMLSDKIKIPNVHFFSALLKPSCTVRWYENNLLLLTNLLAWYIIFCKHKYSLGYTCTSLLFPYLYISPQMALLGLVCIYWPNAFVSVSVSLWIIGWNIGFYILSDNEGNIGTCPWPCHFSGSKSEKGR